MEKPIKSWHGRPGYEVTGPPTSSIIAPLMDRNLAGFIMYWCVSLMSLYFALVMWKEKIGGLSYHRLHGVHCSGVGTTGVPGAGAPLNSSAGTWACPHYTCTRTRVRLTPACVHTEQTIRTDIMCCAPVSCFARINGAEIDRHILWPTNFSACGKVFRDSISCLPWMPRVT